MRRTRDQDLPRLRQEAFLATHQASVDAVLGPGVRPVYARGSSFYNRDRWPLRRFVVEFCSWASRNRGRREPPTLAEIQGLCQRANKIQVRDPHIVIASPPSELRLPVASALIGGAYHEAWHTRYSRRTDVEPEVMKGLIDRVWGRVPDWSPFASMINEWANVVEDIRIERCGNRDFPGADQRMCDLQDFILDMERDARVKRGGDYGAQFTTPMVVQAVFRDVGLGYDTPRQMQAFDEYLEYNPDAVKFVLEGPLSGLLREAVALGPRADVACLRIAMEVVAVMHEAGADKSENKGEGGGQGEARCPNCGSKDVRSKPLGGGRVLLVCGDCGYQEEAEVQSGQGGGSASEAGQESGNSEGGGSTEDEGSDSDKESAEGDDSGDSEEGEGSDPSEGSTKEDGSGDSEGDGEEAGSGDDGGGPDSGAEDRAAGSGAGGGWQDVAEELLQSAGKDSGLLDNNEAFEGEFAAQKKKERKEAHEGEVPFLLADQSLIRVQFVRGDRESADAYVRKMLEDVWSECSYLRARLRSIILAVAQTQVEHGTRFGKLSQRRFVDSKVALMAGRVPSRPNYDVEEQIDTSLAAAIVLDESSSMLGARLHHALQAVLAITEPLDSLDYPVMVLGFRHRRGNYGHADDKWALKDPVNVDVFKAFGERFNSIRWRFGRARAEGGTPMASGLQYGLEGLVGRDERHRVLFVVTDGLPDGRHRPRVKWQIRKAREAGIHVIGVGVGQGASYVKHLFPDHVYVSGIKDLPVELLKKLNSLLDLRGLRARPGSFRAGFGT